MTNMDRRAFLYRLGIGAAGAGAVALLPEGGRAMAGPPAAKAGAKLLPPTTSQAQLSHFGFIFPHLPPFLTDNPDPSVAVPALQALAASMLDPNVTIANTPVQATPQNPNGHRDNLGMGSGLTYAGGQFADHVTTLDLQPQPTEFFGRDSAGFLLDPAGQRVDNFETFDLDLSSLYGGGPHVSPQLYAADRLHFLVQEPNSNGVRDLPRNPDGSAILVEHRNDENQILSQAHLGFLKFHNAVADTFGYEFAKTRDTVIDYYQWAFLHDVLPHFCGQDVVDGLLDGAIPRFYDPGNREKPMTPFEFSGACYRFGHSLVRKAYIINDLLANGTPAPAGAPLKLQVFNATALDLHGGRPLLPFRQIEWGNFFPELNEIPPGPNGVDVNFARLIDTQISSGLFNMPIGGLGGVAPVGSNVLAFRNMVRGFFYGLPSGQDIAEAMGINPIDPTVVIDPTAIPGFTTGTPLWYYMLYESFAANNGNRLGPVGGRIVADVFLAMFEGKGGLFRGADKRFVPQYPIAPVAGKFDLSDLFFFAGV